VTATSAAPDALADLRRRVEERLTTYKAASMPALLASIPDKEPRRHLYDLVPSYPLRAGKGLRPALCLATCLAFGGRMEDALDTAVALELFHNAFLVHDDVEDASESRRGLPTLNAAHGDAIAVNVGDAMNVLSIRPLMANLTQLGARTTWRIFEEIEFMARQSVEGQAMELGWVRDNVGVGLTEADYLRMTLKKTCFYTCTYPMRLGALVALGPDADVDTFHRFGYFMGAAFQIQDDLLNLIGDVQRYGKEIAGDILEGKRTLMLIHALHHASPDERARMSAFLALPRRSRRPEDVAWVFSVMQRVRSLEHARSVARILAGAALQQYTQVFGGLPSSPDKQFLQDVVLYMIERDL
jgi:geranylgeranyl diphosphate synthase type II